MTQPEQGERLQLTLDLGLQKAGDAALARRSRLQVPDPRGRVAGDGPAQRRDYGMGSAPRFDASVLAKPFSERPIEPDLATRRRAAGQPRDRVGLSHRLDVQAGDRVRRARGGPDHSVAHDRRQRHWDLGGSTTRTRRGELRDINVADALKVSSDIFFFQLGAQADDHDDLIQRWAERFGFGHKTGIDLPGEDPGLVPDRRWRTAGYTKYLACVEKAHLARGTMDALYKCGGIDKPWTAGDNVNLAVGQGDLQATPLQLAVAYAAIANDGTIVRPHLGKAVEDDNGFPIHDIRPIRGARSSSPRATAP